MIDLALLKVIKRKERLNKVSKFLCKESLDPRTNLVIEVVQEYFNVNNLETIIDYDVIKSMLLKKSKTEEEQQMYVTLVNKMQEDIPESAEKQMVNQLIELNYATAVANVIQEYKIDHNVNVLESVHQITNSAKGSMERNNNYEFAGLQEAFEDDKNSVNGGLEWHLDCLNQAMRPLQTGDMIIVAARPDKGKTTFLTHALTHFARQTDNNIIWLNNESKKERILKRTIQSALKVTDSQMNNLLNDNKLFSSYTEIIGREDKIRVYDIHSWNTYKVEELLESQDKPIGVIVFDMIDNVKSNGAGLRTDQILEGLYQWARELAVRFNCAVIATSQISVEGDGLEFPPETYLKDSKTGKQGACDAIIMIGSNHKKGQEDLRFIGIPKNKLKKEGARYCNQAVQLDKDRGYYKSLMELETIEQTFNKQKGE